MAYIVLFLNNLTLPTFRHPILQARRGKNNYEKHYSKDFRCLVLDFVANGGSKAEAARRFGISRQSVFDWLKHPPDHKPGKPGPKWSRKYDQEELQAEVQANPDALLRELAASRKVSNNSIFPALRRPGFVRKKLYATAKVFVSLRGRDISSSGVMALNKPIIVLLVIIFTLSRLQDRMSEG